MFKTKKGIMLILALVFVLGIFTGTAAEVTVKDVAAQIDYAMKIKLNGQNFNPVDPDNGVALKPIMYNERTYLPVRAIAEALKVAVDWDEATSTVILGEKTDKVPANLETGLNPYNSYTKYTVDTDLLATDSKSYNYGLCHTQGYSDLQVKLNTNKKYQKFGGEIYYSDAAKEAAKVEIRDTDYSGTLIKELTVQPGQTVPFEVNIGGASTIYIRGNHNNDANKMILGEPYFK